MARFLYSPSLVPLSERWSSDDPSPFVAFLKKVVLFMVAAITMFLSLVAPYLLPLVYGQSIVDCLYLFPLVLVGTGLIALLWLMSDVLIVCREMTWLLVTDGVAFAASLLLVMPP